MNTTTQQPISYGTILNKDIKLPLVFIASILYVLMNSQWVKVNFPNDYRHVYFIVILIVLIFGSYYDPF
jgi:hypothetical protein